MLGRILLPLCGVVALALPQDGAPPAPIAVEHELAALAPENTLVFVDAPGLASVLRQGLGHPLAKALLAGELGRAIEKGSGKTPAQLLGELDERAGLAVLPAIAQLGERGLALAIAERKEQAKWLLLARGANAETQRELIARSLAVAGEKFGFPGAFDEPSDEIEGADVWYVGPELKLALHGALVVASNDAKLLRATLERAGAPESSGLASNDAFRASARDGDALAWAWANLAALDALPKITDTSGLRGTLRNAGAQFLLGPGISALGSGATLTASLALANEDVRVSFRADGLALGAAAKLAPVSESDAVSLAPHSRDVAHALVHRDGAAIFEHRAELFAADQLPGFAKASSDLALFFGGRDFAEAVLPHVSPWLTVVARPVEFAANATPEIPLPAAAFVLEVDDAEELGPVLVSAFQTGVGLVNVDRAQKGLDSLLMKLELAGDVQITSAAFAAPREGDGVDVRYNLAPACAQVGRAFVVGTHVALVADVARELRTNATTVKAHDEHVRVWGGALAEIVRANFAALAARAVLEEGKSRERAEGELRVLAGLLDSVSSAELRVAYPDASSVRVELALDVVAAKE